MSTLSLDRDGVGAAGGRGSIGERILAFVEASHARAAALLLLFALACFVPGQVSLHPIDRDEPRFAQATKQMLETGDFVDIRFQEEARHKKPVGIYWLQAAAVSAGEALGVEAARATIALYRLPSLAGALAAVLLTYWAALPLARRREAFLAAAFMAGSVILMVEARLAKTDAVLLACCVATMGGLARAWLGAGAAPLPKRTVAAFWLGIGVGVLIKGPMVLFFAGLAAAALTVRARSIRWMGSLRPLPGLALALAVAAPWFVAIAARSGADFFAASAGQDMLGKVGTAQTHHWAPPGFYALAAFATFWPAALLAAIGIERAWRDRRDEVAAFLLAWSVPAWIALELVPTKLPHYTMPIYPALAIAAAIAVLRGVAGPYNRRYRFFGFLLALVPLLLLVGLPAGAFALGDGLPASAYLALGAAALLGLLAWRLWLRDRVADATAAALAASIATSVAVFGAVQPSLDALKLSPNAAAAAQRAVGCPEPRVGTLGYREPSLVLLVGTDLAMFDDADEAAAFLAAEPCGVVLATDRFEAAFGAAAARAGLAAVQTDRVRGFNINGGRRVEIGVYARAP